MKGRLGVGRRMFLQKTFLMVYTQANNYSPMPG